MSARTAIPVFLLLLALIAPSLLAEDAPPVEYLDHLRYAQMWLDSKNPRRAVNEYLWAIQTWPRDAQAWEGLARTALGQGDDDLALVAIHGGLERAAEKAAFYEMLGDLHVRNGRALAAQAAYVAASSPKAPQSAADLEAIAAAVAQPGAASRVVLRYFGRAGTDAQRRDASIEAGQPLAPELLRVLVLDARGFPVKAETAWTGGAGLTVEGNTVRAGAEPCDAELTVRVAAATPEQAATIAIKVIGPLAKLEISPEDRKVHAGERVHLRLSASDAAGHRLWLPEYRWSLASEANPAPAELGRPNSVVAPQNGGESHRNYFKVAAEAPAPGTTFRVVASDLDGKIHAEAGYEVAAGAATGRNQQGNIEWLHSWEEALAAAKAAKKPLFVEVMADW